MPGRRIVIVGGGFGGVAAARTARALLDSEHEVTLIDRNRRTYLCGGLPLLMVGERQPARLSRSLGSLAARGVRYVQAEVTRLDLERQVVDSADGPLPYDYLVHASGAEYDWEAVPGSTGAYSFYSIETARRLRRKLRDFRQGRVIIAVASLPYKCPPAPFEAAMVLDWFFKQHGARKNIEIDVFSPEPAPLRVAGHEATQRLRNDLARCNVGLNLGIGVTEVRRSGKEVVLSDGRTEKGDLVITVPVHRASRLARDAGLASANGWVTVDPATLRTQAPNVFAVGDVNVVPMATGASLPKAGVFAAAQGETVARNIAADLGAGERATFPGVGACFLAASPAAAGIVAGQFLAQPAPQVHFQPPSKQGMQRKERFERDWRRFRI